MPEKFEKIEENAKNFEKKHHNLVGIFNTICYTTKVKQDEARALAEKSDAVLVLGSRTSANTRRLYEVAKEVNPNTFFAQDANEALNQTKFIKDIQSVSIVAGASTPPWLIQEVTRLMSETQKNAVETVETEVKNEATLQEQPVEEKEPTTMADLLKSATSVGYTNYKVGKRIKGKVISAGDSGIYVAIGGKKDGFIDKSEASLDGNYNPADFKEGDEIQATILAVNKEYVSLSKKDVDTVRLEEAEAEKSSCSRRILFDYDGSSQGRFERKTRTIHHLRSRKPNQNGLRQQPRRLQRQNPSLDAYASEGKRKHRG